MNYLSTLIVTYNSRSHIPRCLAHLERALEGWGGKSEILLIDNASSDGTLEEAPERAGLRRFPQRENLGFAAGVNVGLREARGDCVLLLNPDCFLLGGLERMLRWMRERPEVGAIGPRILDSGGGLSLSCGMFPGLLTELLENFHARALFPRHPFWARYLYGDWDRGGDRAVDWLTGACLLLRMSAIERVGPLDEDYFLYSEEVDLQWRLARAGYERWFLAEPSARHLGGESTKTLRSGVHQALLLHQFVKSMNLFLRKAYGPASARWHRRSLLLAYALRSLACLARGETEKSKIFASLFPPLLFGFKKNPTGPGP